MLINWGALLACAPASAGAAAAASIAAIYSYATVCKRDGCVVLYFSNQVSPLEASQAAKDQHSNTVRDCTLNSYISLMQYPMIQHGNKQFPQRRGQQHHNNFHNGPLFAGSAAGGGSRRVLAITNTTPASRPIPTLAKLWGLCRLRS